MDVHHEESLILAKPLTSRLSIIQHWVIECNYMNFIQEGAVIICLSFQAVTVLFEISSDGFKEER